LTSSFSISVHILTLLAKAKGEALSSEYMAGSVNINPVLIRKEIINLRDHGIIATREGKNGGSVLNRDAKDIFLSEVYDAVSPSSVLGKSKNKANPKCPVGSQIDKHLQTIELEAEKAMLKHLSTLTLSKFASKFN
jgi:Rrf2 family protein